MGNVKNITFFKSFLFEDSLPPIYNTASVDDLFFENKKNSPFSITNSVIKVNDVPDYFNLETVNCPQKIVVKKTKTIQGHLVELSTFKTIDAYLKSKFGSKSRSNLRRYKNRLETCFNIKYVSYYGNISKEKYNSLFKVLKSLLVRRFAEKQETNYELQHFDEYYKTIYNLIANKKASLFVIYDGEKPISIRINMFKNNRGYYILSGYDIDYSKFHLGAIDMLKNIEWCINNGFKVYNLLKGYDYYKTKWATKSHYYYNHIAYNSNKTSTLLLGQYLYIKEQLKYKFYNVLKRYNLISKLKTFKQTIFSILGGDGTKKITVSISDFYEAEAYKIIEINIEKNNDFAFLRKPVYDFLFLNNNSLNNLTILKLADYTNKFVIHSKGKKKLITVNGIT
ncbi:GNAT family N-acetyltransferase [Gelatiniphilus marinus]|uniref:GNAT family N-acetyltransferase n=1 Tax=Gelatiniphilus marinus TaxID=1759464 RepID=A0ABW5JPD9_9FLAO